MAELSHLQEQLIARAHAAGPTLKTFSDWAEQHGRLHEQAVAALVEAGVPRLFLAAGLGGDEVDPVTCARVCEVLADYDASAAWHVMVYNAARLMSATWPATTLEHLWAADPDVMICASGHTPFTGVTRAEGYVVAGQNSFVSGCHHARYIMSPMVVDERTFFVVLPRAECEIVDNWDSLGMRGSGSNDVRAEGVTIPSVLAVETGEAPALSPYHQGRLYRCPSRVVFATYIPVALSLARQALAELDALAQQKVPYASDRKLRNRSQAQMHYGRALAKYRAVREYFYNALRTVWDRADEGYQFSQTERADLYLAGTHTMQTCAEVVRHVADAAGSSVLTRGQPLERIVRDMETLRHHGFANESRYASVAQVLWDAELDYPLMLR